MIGRHARLLSFSPLVQRSLAQHDYLQNLRRNHPAWRLLAADSASLVVGFLNHCFVEPNVRVLAEEDLAVRLDDHLYHLRGTLGEESRKCLTVAERELFEDLRDDRIAERVRLEQERFGYGAVQAAVRAAEGRGTGRPMANE